MAQGAASNYVCEMPTPIAEPCVTPVVTPVVETLASTGTDATFLAIAVTVAAVFVAVGVVSVMKGQPRRGILTALVLPVLLLGGLALNSPQPAYATTDAPTVTTSAVIDAVFDGSLVSYSQLDAAVFDNPEGCGVLSYQWQVGVLFPDEVWADLGEPVTTANPATMTLCAHEALRLATTLTNSAGSATDISNEVAVCT
jgi:hypothetical protein